MPKFYKKVIHGKKVGRKLGIKTLNFACDHMEFPFGVYLCQAKIQGKTYKGVLHYGPKMTIDNSITLECHVLDFNKDIYDKMAKITVLDKIREIRKCQNLAKLRDLIKRDIEKARRITLTIPE